MIGMRVKLTLNGYSEVDRVLDRFQRAPNDMRPAWDDIANDFAQMNRQQFAREGSSTEKWAPLVDWYREWKEREYPGRKILELTGALKKTLTQQPFGIDVREPKYMILGTAEPTGKWHHEGEGNLPVRKVIELTEYRRRKWVKMVHRHIIENARGDVFTGRRIR